MELKGLKVLEKAYSMEHPICQPCQPCHRAGWPGGGISRPPRSLQGLQRPLAGAGPSDPPVKGEVIHQTQKQMEQGAEKGAEQGAGQDIIRRLCRAVHLPPSGSGGRARGGHRHTLSSNVLKYIYNITNSDFVNLSTTARNSI